METTFPTNVIEEVRESCERVAKEARDVRVDDAAVVRFAQQLGADADLRARLAELHDDDAATQQPVVFEGAAVPRRLSVHFASVDAELDFAVVLALVQLGSGYRRDLHAVLGRGASDTMTYGTVAMQHALGDLTAAALAGLTLADVRKWFQLPEYNNNSNSSQEEDKDEDKDESKEKEKKESREGVARLGAMVHGVLVDAGHALAAHGHASFAALVAGCDTAAALATALCRVVPGFADSAAYGGARVWLAKKAQLAVTDVHARLVAHGRAGYADVETLTVFVDNVLPAVLRAAGVLVLSPALAHAIDTGTPLAHGSSHETELRACAVAAAERIVAAARAAGLAVTPRELDWLLWTVGKRPDLRRVPRHACRDTVFY